MGVSVCRTADPSWGTDINKVDLRSTTGRPRDCSVNNVSGQCQHRLVVDHPLSIDNSLWRRLDRRSFRLFSLVSSLVRRHHDISTNATKYTPLVTNSPHPEPFHSHRIGNPADDSASRAKSRPHISHLGASADIATRLRHGGCRLIWQRRCHRPRDSVHKTSLHW